MSKAEPPASIMVGDSIELRPGEDGYYWMHSRGDGYTPALIGREDIPALIEALQAIYDEAV